MQSTHKTVAKNTFVQIITHLTLRGSGLIIAILAARLWGASRFGDYTFVLAFAAVFTFMMDLGINLMLVREIARRRDQVSKYLNNSMTLTILLSLITLFIITQVVGIFNYPDNIKFAIYLGCLCTVISVLNSVFSGVFHAFEKMEYETLSTIVGRVVFLILGVLVFIFKLELLHLLSALLISTLARLLVNIRIYYANYGRIRLKFDLTFSKHLLKLAYPFGLNIAFSIAYVRFDVLMLSYFKDSHSVGIYAAGTTIILSLTMLAHAFNRSLIPRMSESFSHSIDKLTHIAKRSIEYLVIFSFPFALSLFFLSEKIILLVYGSRYTESIIIFKILCIMIPLKFIDSALASILTSTDRQGARTRTIFYAAVFNVLTNLYFIPKWGSVGASVTTLLTEVFLFVLLYKYVRKSTPLLFILQLSYKPTLAVIAMCLPFYFLAGFNLILALAIGISIYLIILLITKAISKDQLFELRTLTKFG